MKIYTKKGDGGETSCGGRRVSKACVEVAVLGDIDELNSILGVVRVSGGLLVEETDAVLKIQRDLFEIGSAVGSEEPKTGLAEYLERRVSELEEQIDEMEIKLPQLAHFIVPGGNQASAGLQVARAVCRRAERHLIKAKIGQNKKKIQKYLNRLSDWLFVKARWLARESEELEWNSAIER